MILVHKKQKRGERKLSRRKNSQSSKSEKRKLNKQTWVVTVFFSIIFFFMIGYYVYFIVADSQEVASNSYNKRVDDRQEKIQRGTIYASHGEKLAYSDPGSTGNKNRHYPYSIDECFVYLDGMENLDLKNHVTLICYLLEIHHSRRL